MVVYLVLQPRVPLNVGTAAVLYMASVVTELDMASTVTEPQYS